MGEHFCAVDSAHFDKDHGLRNVDPAFVIANEATPAGHLAEGPLHNLTTWR